MPADTDLGKLLTHRLYSFAEADYIANVRRGTSQRWLTGYVYQRGAERITRPPVTDRPKVSDGASFIDLVEIVAIGRLRAIGFSLPAIRRVVQHCRDLFKAERPLVTLQFKTDGREIFVREGSQLVEVLRRKGMQAWSEVLSPFLEQLDYAESVQMACRWWPLGKDHPVVVEPDYGFGRPVIAGKGVRVEIIVERFAAGDSTAQICEDFNLAPEQVEAALRFDLQRRAA